MLRVYQEDWFPFQNLPRALKAFEAETGIRSSLSWDVVGIGTIERMFHAMEDAFTEGAFDLICCDEIILRQMIEKDLAIPLDDGGFDWGDVTGPVKANCIHDGRVYGLPCVNICNMLMIRGDLLDAYGLPIPGSWEELERVGAELQRAVRADGKREFYAFETRGAAGAAHAGWSIGTFIGSFGASWLENGHEFPADRSPHIEAVEIYLRILRTLAGPTPDNVSFVEMRDNFRSGRAGMVMEVGMEYAHAIRADPFVAETARFAMVPAGPQGRFPDLYCPVWSIPKQCRDPDAAMRLARYLTSRDVLLQDALTSECIEVSSHALLHSQSFTDHFDSGLLSVVRDSRAMSREGRPFGTLGLAHAKVVGDALNQSLRNGSTARETVDRIYEGFANLHAAAG